MHGILHHVDCDTVNDVNSDSLGDLPLLHIFHGPYSSASIVSSVT